MRPLKMMTRWTMSLALGAAGVSLALGAAGCPDTTPPPPPDPPADPGGAYVGWSIVTYAGGGEGAKGMGWVTLGSLHTTPEWGPERKASLTVTALGGASIDEVWPPAAVTKGEAGQPSASWADFTIGRSACAKGWAPAPEALACQGLGAGQDCAASRLSSWNEGVGGHCVHLGDTQSQMLLLRGSAAEAIPPITRVGPNTWKNVGDDPVHALMIRDASEPERIHFVAELAPQASVTLDAQTAEQGSKEPFAARAREHLRAAGLFDSHIAASVRAQDELAPEGWVARGLLSRQALDRIVTVEAGRDAGIDFLRAGLFMIAP